jgi:hypothetical protein
LAKPPIFPLNPSISFFPLTSPISTSRCAYGSDGSDAGRVRGRLHDNGGGCVRDAAEWQRHQCRGGGSGLPAEDDGYAEADTEE